MAPPDRVTAFLRHRSSVLLTRAEHGWTGLTRRLDADPSAELESLLAAALPSAVDATVVRGGPPVPIKAGATSWQRYPFLVDVPDRRLQLPDGVATAVWASPTILHRHRSAPGAWRAYRRCGPTLETVRRDDEHGSTYVSLRALEALRDLAIDVGARATDPANRRSTVREQARQLATCRPELVAVGVRIDRVMGAGERIPAPSSVADRCERVIETAVTVDSLAAGHVAPRINGGAVLTLSRSGTVATGLERGDPDRIWVLESRPGREGVETAESLGDGSTPVSLAVDAAASHLLEREDVDVVLVGADAVGPSGTVRNKVGTLTLARAAQAADVPVVVVSATDKISPTPLETGPSGPITPVYDGDRSVEVAYPLFDRTPPRAIAALVTESGELTPAEIREHAARHRARRRWRQARSG